MDFCGLISSWVVTNIWRSFLSKIFTERTADMFSVCFTCCRFTCYLGSLFSVLLEDVGDAETRIPQRIMNGVQLIRPLHHSLHKSQLTVGSCTMMKADLNVGLSQKHAGDLIWTVGDLGSFSRCLSLQTSNISGVSGMKVWENWLTNPRNMISVTWNPTYRGRN